LPHGCPATQILRFDRLSVRRPYGSPVTKSALRQAQRAPGHTPSQRQGKLDEWRSSSQT
jgi:hypothetical protein